MARLVLLGEAFNGRTYELKVDKTTVGRVSDNAFEIPEASVSSHHAEIILRGGDVVIRDLDSTNGTSSISRLPTSSARRRACRDSSPGFARARRTSNATWSWDATKCA